MSGDPGVEWAGPWDACDFLRPPLRLAVKTIGWRMGLLLWLLSRVRLGEGGIRQALIGPSLRELQLRAAELAAYGRVVDPGRAPIAIISEERRERELP